MHHLRILHNGDLRKETAIPSPHWMVKIGVNGNIWGEVLMRDWIRALPKDFCLPDHQRFFEIPPELRRHKLEKSPHYEEIIVIGVSTNGDECSFLMSQLEENSRLKSALSDLVSKINEIVQQGH